ncbi:MAG: FkbM family methyltransferase [Actinobacteria bacterium]|nr:FkbM family methyltransferase [Actinomycetota bacterium]
MIKNYLRTNSRARRIRELLTATSRIFDSQTKSLAHICESTEISTIIDVGANVGQFSIDMRRGGFSGQIFSFEPVLASFMILQKVSATDEKWDVYNLALGMAQSVQEIFVSGNSGLSSSLLEMNSLHLKNFPNSRNVRKELVSVSTVDRQIERLGIDPSKSLLKLDVQGFEYNVLMGALSNLRNFHFCYLGVSLSPLYEGEHELLEILNLLGQNGHTIIEIYRGVSSKRGSLLQVDIVTSID